MEVFTAAIQKAGANPYVDVPLRVSRALQRDGYVPVKGRINRFSFRSTLVPVGDGRHRLYVNGAMRRGAGVGVGDRVRIALEIDPEPRDLPMPLDLARALRQAGGWTAFRRLAPADREEILAQHAELKTLEARERNVARVLEILRRTGLLE